MPKATVLLLRSGSRFKLVCSDCRKTIADNIPTGHVAFAKAGLAVQHATVCAGGGTRNLVPSPAAPHRELIKCVVTPPVSLFTTPVEPDSKK